MTFDNQSKEEYDGKYEVCSKYDPTIDEDSEPINGDDIEFDIEDNDIKAESLVETQNNNSHKKTIIFDLTDYKPFIEVSCFVLNLILDIIFAVIMFKNKDQVSIISNYNTWLGWWIVYSIFTIGLSIYAVHNGISYGFGWDNSTTIPAWIVGILLIVFSIIGFTNTGKLKKDFDPTTFISIETLKKYGSVSASTYTTKLDFNLHNNSDITVSYVYGDMTFYNCETVVSVWHVYFSGTLYSGSDNKFWVECKEYNTNDLYSIPYTTLGITYKITSMKFNNEFEEHEYNGKTNVLKTIVTNDMLEEYYNDAISLYNSESYTEAKQLFSDLGNYKNSKLYLKTIISNDNYNNIKESLLNYNLTEDLFPDNYLLYSYDLSESFYYNRKYHNAIYLEFDTNSNNEIEYLSNYRYKLMNKGFTFYDSCMYKKDNIVIYTYYYSGGIYLYILKNI